MYRITLVIVKSKKNKELYNYFKDLCENYTSLKNVANFHIRQHMTGLKKSEDVRYDNETESINLFREYIPKMSDNSKAYYDKRVSNISADDTLSDDEKQIKIANLKQPITYNIPTEDKWFLNNNVIDGVLRLSEKDALEDENQSEDKDKSENNDTSENKDKTYPYNRLPAQVNQNAIKEVCTEWNSYFKSLKDYKKNPFKYKGMPKIPKYYKGLSTVTLTNINCKFHFNGDKCTLSFPKTRLTLNLGEYIKSNAKLKQVEVKPIADYFKVIVTTEVADTVADLKESDRVASIDIGGKNTITLTTNVSGLNPFVISGDVLKTRNENWLSAIDAAKSELRRGLDPKDYTKPYTSKKIKRMYANRDRFLSDYFHKIALYIINYCKKNDMDTIVIGRNKGQKQNIDMGHKNNREFFYTPFNKLYTYLSYLCERNGINYIETEESYTSQASFFDGDEVPTFKKDDDTVYSFSGKRTNRDTYVTKDGTVINADVNGSLNIMRKAVPKLCVDIKIEDMIKVEELTYEFFYPPCKKSA